jgi:hypothetical protein
VLLSEDLEVKVSGQNFLSLDTELDTQQILEFQ